MATIPIQVFADRLNEIVPVIMKEFASRHTNELSKGKITLPQFLILHFISREGETKMTDLAYFMKISTAAMTGIVDRLVKYGYVTRQFDPNDRRVTRVKLNAKGAELVRKIDQQRRQMMIKTFSQISDAERQQYLRILTRIRDILTKGKEA
jgi:DNA-binding MarR family transcriptional regulator